MFGFEDNCERKATTSLEKAAALPVRRAPRKSTRLLDLTYLGIVRSQPTWILSGSLILSLLA